MYFSKRWGTYIGLLKAIVKFPVALSERKIKRKGSGRLFLNLITGTCQEYSTPPNI